MAGTSWYPRGHPVRYRATYRRLQGVEQFLGFYDVYADCLVGQVRKRKTWKDVLVGLQRLRGCYSKGYRLYIVMDNLRTHKKAEVLDYMARNRMEPVWTPTYASWLNVIEAHFGSMKKFVLNNSDDGDHRTRRRRIYRYLTWRNKQHGSSDCPLTQLRRIKLERH
jgi:transposase